MDQLLKQNKSTLKIIIKELTNASSKLLYEDRFDVSSLKNNINNAIITGDMDYINRYFDEFQPKGGGADDLR